MELHNYSAPSSSHSERKKTKCHVQCSVYGCQNRSDVGLYKLPSANTTNDKARRKQWISHLRMGKVPKHTLVCGKHFQDSDFIPRVNGKGKIRRLKKTAVPSQNLPKSSIHRSPPFKKKMEIRNRTERMAKRKLRLNERVEISPILTPEKELEVIPNHFEEIMARNTESNSN